MTLYAGGNALELGDKFGHAPRGDDLEGRVASGKRQLEADLVVATSCQQGFTRYPRGVEFTPFPNCLK